MAENAEIKTVLELHSNKTAGRYCCRFNRMHRGYPFRAPTDLLT